MCYYVAFDCDTVEDCRAAVAAFWDPPEPGEMREVDGRVDTAFAVNWHGPRFYHESLPAPWWGVREIADGEFYERNRGTDFMDFWAIDRARRRVYFHHESGGFPDDPPSVRSRLDPAPPPE